MPKYENVRKINFIKKIEKKKSKAIMVNLTNLLPRIFDRDNSTKKNATNKEAMSLVTKW